MNLFIVGAPKCGTTAWGRYLDWHPDIFMTEVKETSYFARDLPGMQWVKSDQQYARLFERGRKCKIIGDPSAAHLFSKVAAKHIAEYNPDAKVLIFLRDQEDYLPALHNHYLAHFDETIEDFGTAWRQSGTRGPGTFPRSCTEPRMLDYAAMGRFYEQVARYYEHLPAEQIRVFHLKDWASNPRGAYLEILDFLGVEDDGRTEFPRVNEARHFPIKWIGKLIMKPPFFARWGVALLRKISGKNALNLKERASSIFASKGYQRRISPELATEIRAFFADDNRRLQALLKDFEAKQPSRGRRRRR